MNFPKSREGAGKNSDPALADGRTIQNVRRRESSAHLSAPIADRIQEKPARTKLGVG